jgi:hypothetical protein
MDSQRQANPNLSVLNSTSSTAVYKAWMYVCAFVLHIQEQIFDLFRIEIQDKIAAQRVHNATWYRDMAFRFQYDTTTNTAIPLILNEYTPTYETIDATKRIITRCTVREGSSRIYVRVNKGVVPNLLPLTSNELNAFVSYMNQIKDAGTKIVVQSFPAEKVIIDIEVDNATIKGSLEVEDVQDILQEYLRTLPIDGVIDLQKLEAALLNDDRVANIKINQLYVTSATGLMLGELFSLAKGINIKAYPTVSGHAILNLELSKIIVNAV